jgi:hypothetical protein
MEINKNFVYFNKDNEIVIKLIKKQGDTVCQQKIGVDYIKEKLKDFDFGFIRKLPEAQIGKIKKSKSSEIINSFALCKLLPHPLLKS